MLDVLSADRASIIRDGEIVASLAAPDAASSEEAEGFLRLPLEDEPAMSLIVVRRSAFTEDEHRLVRAIARLVMVTVHSLRALQRERKLRDHGRRRETDAARELAELLERQALLERLRNAQRALVRRGSTRDVSRSIIAGAQDLFTDEIVVVRLVDEDDPAYASVAAASGVEGTFRVPVGAGPDGPAMTEGRLTVLEDEEARREAARAFGLERVTALMTAPLTVDGAIVGALIVGSRRAGRRYRRLEREALLAYAEDVATAIADARALRAAAEGTMHDPLTGLPSRPLFLDRLRHALAGAQRTAARVGVLCLDLDRFQLVNDGYGHSAGNEVLVEVAARVRACLRAGDSASRFGADEFGMIVDVAMGSGDVVPVAERILHALRAPFVVGGREIALGASIGIAVSGGGESAEELVRFATVAMHEAKAAGRGRYELFEPAMHERLLARVELQSDLQRALPNDELVLHYQPIVSLETGETTGFEALVRWRHPVRGLLGPEAFIPLAEDLGLITALDRWVLERACEDLGSWQRSSGRPLQVGVNLAAEDFRDPSLTATVAAALARTGLDPSSLVLEITETSILASDRIAEVLGSLKALGVGIAIDDFGTGYASLSYLQRFPIDTIKIDRSFMTGLVRDVTERALRTGEDPWALARAIVKIGHSLGIRTVAEGVEDEAQRRALMELGCTAAQGFHFSRPLPPAEIGALLGAANRRHLRSVG